MVLIMNNDHKTAVRLAMTSIIALLCTIHVGLACALFINPEQIVEFHNVQLDHYFLAGQDEARFIDQGGAGSGWVRTGQSFWEESQLSFLFVGVCRFYGSVSPGPNSHFFTSNRGECEWLQSLGVSLPPGSRKWNYEGIGFGVVPVSNDGTCPLTERSSATAPVYRLYNRGFERGVDSNHRYTTSRQIVDEMKSRGWADEGVAWCTRPNGPWS